MSGFSATRCNVKFLNWKSGVAPSRGPSDGLRPGSLVEKHRPSEAKANCDFKVLCSEGRFRSLGSVKERRNVVASGIFSDYFVIGGSVNPTPLGFPSHSDALTGK